MPNNVEFAKKQEMVNNKTRYWIYGSALAIVLAVIFFSKCGDGRKPATPVISGAIIRPPAGVHHISGGGTVAVQSGVTSPDPPKSVDGVKWKKVSHQTTVETVAEVKNVDPVRVTEETPVSGIIAYRDSTLNHDIRLHIDSLNNVHIDSIRLNSRFIITTGVRKAGWLGLKTEPYVSVVSLNPEMTITGLEDIAVKTPKKFYQKPIFWFATGLFAGAYLTTTQIHIP